jgi:hypothetical protein
VPCLGIIGGSCDSPVDKLWISRNPIDHSLALDQHAITEVERAKAERIWTPAREKGLAPSVVLSSRVGQLGVAAGRFSEPYSLSWEPKGTCSAVIER